MLCFHRFFVKEIESQFPAVPASQLAVHAADHPYQHGDRPKQSNLQPIKKSEMATSIKSLKTYKPVKDLQTL